MSNPEKLTNEDIKRGLREYRVTGVIPEFLKAWHERTQRDEKDYVNSVVDR